MIHASDELLLLVDAQPARFGLLRTRSAESLTSALTRLVRAANLLDVPTIATAGGLASERPPFVEGVDAETVVWRTTPNAFATAALAEAVAAAGRKSVVVAGVATEIGVAFAALAARDLGYRVRVAIDACASSDDLIERATLATLVHRGVECVGANAVIAGWQGDFAAPNGREILQLILR